MPWRIRIINNYFCITDKFHSEMSYYGFNKFDLIYGLFTILLFKRYQKVVRNTNIVFINLRTFWEEYFIPIRFLEINQTWKYHIFRNLSRLLIKPNMGIVTLLDIHISNHHIPSNLDAKG